MFWHRSNHNNYGNDNDDDDLHGVNNLAIVLLEYDIVQNFDGNINRFISLG